MNYVKLIVIWHSHMHSFIWCECVYWSKFIFICDIKKSKLKQHGDIQKNLQCNLSSCIFSYFKDLPDSDARPWLAKSNLCIMHATLISKQRHANLETVVFWPKELKCTRFCKILIESLASTLKEKKTLRTVPANSKKEKNYSARNTLFTFACD